MIEELKYQPSALARSLIQQRSFTLGVVTAGLKYFGPSRTLNGITNKAEELGYALLLEELLQFDTDDIKPLLENLLARHVDGIVWAVPEVGNNRRWVDEILNDVPVPVVFLTMQPRPGVSTVAVDNYDGRSPGNPASTGPGISSDRSYLRSAGLVGSPPAQTGLAGYFEQSGH